jgi:hypothetical protein
VEHILIFILFLLQRLNFHNKFSEGRDHVKLLHNRIDVTGAGWIFETNITGD